MIADVRARTATGARNGLRYLLYGFGLLLALLTASCGNTIISVGTPCITLTAKPSRFTSYIVTVDEITMTRTDGTVIELPTIDERMDLANLTAYANLLEAPAVEIGTYQSVTFILDFSSEAPYIAIDSGGQSVPVTSLIDPASGTAPVTVTMTVNFDPNNRLVINDQQSTLLNFDIDLEASNIIGTTSDGTLQVVVKPFWNVSAQPTFDKPVFARGLYVLTDPKNNQIVFNVRPLHDVLDNPFGALKVNIDNNTYYNINGTAYVGAAGFAALGALQNVYADLQIAAYGPSSGSPWADLSTITPVFNATQIYVGSSLESTLEDQVTGVVTAISGDTLSVNAAYVDRLGDYGYTQNLPVTVGSGTIVSMDGVAGGTLSVGSISVGQVITALGLGNVTDTADFNPASLDATGSQLVGAQVRIQNTPMLATFNSANSPTDALVNLVAVDRLEPSYLNFAGTGNAGAGKADANAASYEITTPTDFTGTPPGTFLKLNGTVTAFGQGPPFYTVSSATTAIEQQLVIQWSGTGGSTTGSGAPFLSMTSSAIVVNLADPNVSNVAAGGAAFVRTGPAINYNLLTSPPPGGSQFTITFNTTNPQHPPQFGVGSVAQSGYLDSDPQHFVNDYVSVSKGDTVLMQKLVAYGQYDPTTGTFSADRMTINAQ